MPGMKVPDDIGGALPRVNIELKARLASFDAARPIASSLADRRLPDQHQIDTYFNCRNGRLKLREIVGERAELIAYDRPDELACKASHYYLLPVADAEQCKQALTLTLGLRCVVAKRREIYLHRDVRIHLDRVESLGAFLEFEAVLDEQHGEAAARELLAVLRQRFAITDDALLEQSYGEMIEPPAAASR